MKKYRIFFDGRNRKLKNLLEKVKGIKVTYPKIRYGDTDKYDFIVVRNDELWYTRMRDEYKNSAVIKSFDDGYVRKWIPKVRTVNEFFEIINCEKNIALIEKL